MLDIEKIFDPSDGGIIDMVQLPDIFLAHPTVRVQVPFRNPAVVLISHFSYNKKDGDSDHSNKSTKIEVNSIANPENFALVPDPVFQILPA